MRRLEWELDGERVQVWAQRDKSGVWVHHQGKSFYYEKQSAKSSSGVEVGDGQIAAPMPGKIVKINFAQGDRVDASDVVVVMEAMKMEYSLNAGKEGVVDKIDGKEGQQVELGQVLAVIKGEEDASQD